MTNREYVVFQMNYWLNLFTDAQESGDSRQDQYLNTFNLYNNLLNRLESK